MLPAKRLQSLGRRAQREVVVVSFQTPILHRRERGERRDKKKQLKPIIRNTSAIERPGGSETGGRGQGGEASSQAWPQGQPVSAYPAKPSDCRRWVGRSMFVTCREFTEGALATDVRAWRSRSLRLIAIYGGRSHVLHSDLPVLEEQVHPFA